MQQQELCCHRSRRQPKNASLTGFEFAGGIPGTLGGAVVMNAGAMAVK